MATVAITSEIHGDKALMDAFRALRHEPTQRKIARPALRKAARPVFEAAKAAAPVDQGFLRRGLHLRALTYRDRSKFGVSVFTPKASQLAPGKQGSKWYYPAHVEIGHAKRGFGRTTKARQEAHLGAARMLTSLQRRKAGRGLARRRDEAGVLTQRERNALVNAAVENEFGGRFVKGRAFMRTAFDARRESSAAIVRDEMWRGIEAVWAGRPPPGANE